MAASDHRRVIEVADPAALAATAAEEVAGADKRAILTRVFAGENLPANRARSIGETVWLVDRAAMPENVDGH